MAFFKNGDDTGKKTSPVQMVYDWVEAAITALITVVVLFTFVFRMVGVDGTSMYPKLKNEDRLVLRCIAYTPDHGDIVVINRYTDKPLIKRVIAVGGDTLDITDGGAVILNGETLSEAYLPEGLTTPRKDFEGPITVPEGYVFVMGDNRHDSHDSRYLDIGCVSVRDVVGKAVFRLWPFSSLGGLYNE